MRFNKKAFTMIELIIVISVISILSTTIIINIVFGIEKAKIAVQKNHVQKMNKALNQYLVDKKMYPRTLHDLVRHGSLGEVPENPVTKKIDWLVLYKKSRFSKDLKWEKYDASDRSRVVTKVKAPN